MKARWGTPLLHAGANTDDAAGDRKRRRREEAATPTDAADDTEDEDEDEDELEATEEEPEDETSRVFDLGADRGALSRLDAGAAENERDLRALDDKRTEFLGEIRRIVRQETLFARLVVVDALLEPPSGQGEAYEARTYAVYDIEFARREETGIPDVVVQLPAIVDVGVPLAMPQVVAFATIRRREIVERPGRALVDTNGQTRVSPFNVGERVRLESRFGGVLFRDLTPPQEQYDQDLDAGYAVDRRENVLFASSDASPLIAYVDLSPV